MSIRARVFSCLLSIAVTACSGTPTAPSAAAPPPVTESPAATGGGSPPPTPASPTWDLDARGVPQFVTRDYIDLGRIHAISRFRSSEGHDYSDAVESCRSMKHYFRPAGSGAGTIPIVSPVTGTVVATVPEWAGTQVLIRPDDYPAFTVVLFHVNLTVPLAEQTRLEAGQPLGTHIGDQTWSDVAIRADTPQGFRLVSWFQAVTDAVLAGYRARGLASREAAIISRAERDADPLACSGPQGGSFLTRGRLEGWVTLR